MSSSAAIRSPDRWRTRSACARIPASVVGVDIELERGRQAHGADHPQCVLLEPCRRLADGAQDPRACVEGAAVRVDERVGLSRAPAPGHGVHREIATSQVLLDRLAELDVMRTAEVRVVMVDAEGRDLEVLAIAPDGHRPELVLVDGVREERDDLLGECLRGKVPVVGLAPQDDVA